MLTVLLTSPRVAPGLLTWQAWDLLRSGTPVVAPEGHPLLPALASAGVLVELAPSPPAAGVWIAPAGAAAADFPGAAVVAGSVDVPGAHLIDLVVTMDRLRTGCPWDAKQTHQSLAPHLLEEPYEAMEALESGDMAAFAEELGDVLLQVVFHARIAADFDIDDVADQIVDKLVRRHPHVFGSVTVADADEVKRNWDEIKKQERSLRGAVASAVSVLDGVPFGQPALALAAQLQRRASRAGVPDALAELPDTAGDAGWEIGADLFQVVARARAAGVDPELALRAVARCYRDLVREWEQEPRS